MRAAGSLGWSFPASLGAKCAAPNRAVLCFTGDGGFYYHLAELESARRCGIAAVVVVNNNSGFGQNLTGVRRIAGNRPGRGEALVRFGPTDFTAVAKSFGVRGIRVERPGEIAPALAEALGAGEPVVVDVVTDLEPRAPEPWCRQSARGADATCKPRRIRRPSDRCLAADAEAANFLEHRSDLGAISRRRRARQP